MIIRFKPYYELELLQALSEDDKVREFFSNDLITRMEEEETVYSYVVCSNKAVFHLSGTVSRHNVYIQGSEVPNSTVECAQDSLKVNVFCVLSKTKVYVPIFFTEPAVAGMTYLDMLEMWLGWTGQGDSIPWPS
jgi:hypothetical protein